MINLFIRNAEKFLIVIQKINRKNIESKQIKSE